MVYARARARAAVPGECYGGASRALWTAGQSSGYTYWTLDSGHLSLSSPTIRLPYGRPGGVGEEDDEGRIEPSRIPGNTCRCLRPDPDRASLRTYYIRARGYTVYRETRNVRAGINKAPYCVNYDRNGVSALPVWPQGCFESGDRGSLTRATPRVPSVIFLHLDCVSREFVGERSCV